MAFPLLAPVLLVGLKALLLKLLTVVVVYVIYKALMSYSDTLMDWGLNQITANVDLSQTTIQLTGMAAWLAETLKLGQIISLFISFCVVRFLISMVRG